MIMKIGTAQITRIPHVLPQLTKELEAFDPSFFEEIEDLKYNHQEAVRKNIQYEELLAKLTQQHGFSVSELDLPGSQGLS